MDRRPKVQDGKAPVEEVVELEVLVEQVQVQQVREVRVEQVQLQQLVEEVLVEQVQVQQLVDEVLVEQVQIQQLVEEVLMERWVAAEMASLKLDDIFSECGVSPNLASDLVAEGWSIKTFAFSASDEMGFDSSLPEMCAAHGDVPLLQTAALRAAWHMARRSQVPDSSVPPIPSEPAPSSDVSSWTEAFAPKMEHAMVQKLKDAFLANYPSELLTPDLMPSLRLLSLVYSQIQKKQWRWIPWKYRMSVARADEVQGRRLPKLPKLEGMQLHSLLMDEPPCLEINSNTMGVNAIRNMMEVHDRAVAICQGAHLANLKAYTQKFISFLTQRTDSDSGLRSANILEAQQGDQKIWGVISDRGWTMDDSLHELTHIRHDLPGYAAADACASGSNTQIGLLFLLPQLVFQLALSPLSSSLWEFLFLFVGCCVRLPEALSPLSPSLSPFLFLFVGCSVRLPEPFKLHQFAQDDRTAVTDAEGNTPLVLWAKSNHVQEFHVLQTDEAVTSPRKGRSPTRSCSSGSRKKEPRSRSRTADRNCLPSEMKMSRERPKTVSKQTPFKTYAGYGFDLKQCASFKEATNLFTMRLVAPQPGTGLPVTYDTSPVNGGPTKPGGGFQCTLRISNCCAELLWGKQSAEGRCFVGEIQQSRRLAELSAAEKFWQDADVLKKAENLPPSNREAYSGNKRPVRTSKVDVEPVETNDAQRERAVLSEPARMRIFEGWVCL
eukprot:s2619_g12.t1